MIELAVAIVGSAALGLLLGLFIGRRGTASSDDADLRESVTSLAQLIAALEPDERGCMQIEAGGNAAALLPLVEAINGAFGKMFFVLARRPAKSRELIANIAHDFRGPLAAIRGFSETLRDRARTVSDPTLVEYLDIIERNVAALDRIVESSLALSRIEAGLSAPRVKSFLAQDLFAAIEERFVQESQRRRVRVSCTADTPGTLIYGDYGMIERVLVNLVQNAIAHTPEGKCIQVTAAQVNGATRLSVLDEGVGIAPEHLPHIFDEFYRVQADRSRLSGGAGLGLALVKKIVEAHKCTIHVQSEINRGARFWFDLPVVR